MGVPERKKEFQQKLRGRLKDSKQAFANALPETVSVDRFLDVAQTAALEIDDLPDARFETVYTALKKCAKSGLLPDGEESTIIVYGGEGGEAVWTPMVKGVIRLILRSPGVTKVEARVVRKKDDFAFRYGLDPRCDHVPNGVPPSDENYDPTVEKSYAIVWRRQAEPQFDVLYRDPEIERARAQSRAPKSPAWRLWYPEMARKVALHRVSKYVDLAPEAARAIQWDIEGNWEEDYAAQRTREARERVQSDADGRSGRILEEIKGEGDEGESARESSSSDSEGEGPAESEGASEDDEEAPEGEEYDRDIQAFLAEEDLGREDVLTAADEEELPAGFCLVNYAPTWYHPVDRRGIVREDVKARKEKAIAWCRDYVGETGSNGEASSDDSSSFDWTPLEDLSVVEMRQEMGRIVRGVDGWEFPDFIVRMGTKLFEDRKDELPTDDEGKWIDVTDLERRESAKLLAAIRTAVEKKVEDGEDVAESLS